MEGSAIGSLITALNTSFTTFSVSTLTEVITAGLAIAVPLVLGWFAFRWIYGKIKGALFAGR